MGGSHRIGRLSLIGGAILHAAVTTTIAADIVRTNAFGLGADAEVREQNGGTELRGDHWELAARYTPGTHNQHIMVRFDLSGINAADLLPNTVTDFRLFVNRTSWSTAAGTFQYYALNSNASNQYWNESTVNFQNAPGLLYDGNMSTRGFTSDTTLLGELGFSGAKAPGTALDFSSTNLTNVIRDAIDHYGVNGGTPVLTLFVALKEGSPSGQNYIVKSNDADSLSGTGLLSGTQYNPQLFFPIVATGEIDSNWVNGGVGLWNDATRWSPGIAPNNNATQTFNVTVASGSVTLQNPVNVKSLKLLGNDANKVQLLGDHEVTVQADFLCSGGVIGGTASLNLHGTSVFSSERLTESYREIHNYGSASFAPSKIAAAVIDYGKMVNHVGASWDLDDITISGTAFENYGMLTTKQSTYGQTSYIRGLQNEGVVQVYDGTRLAIINGSSSTGEFIIDAGGSLRFHPEYAAGSSYTLGPASLIRGGGSVAVEESSIVTIDGIYGVSGELFVDSDGTIEFSSSASVSTAPSLLTVLGTAKFDTQSAIQLNDILLAQGRITGSDAIVASSLVGSGTVSNAATVTGLLDVQRAFSATLMFQNSLSLTSTSSVLFDPSSGRMELIEVAGQLQLSGNLVLDIVPFFSAGSLTLMASAFPITGAFSNVASGERLNTLDGSASFVVTYAGLELFISNPGPPVAIPEPAAAAGFAVLTGIVSWRRRVRSVKSSN